MPFVDVPRSVLAVELVKGGFWISSLNQLSQRVLRKDVVNVREENLVGLSVDCAYVTSTRLVPRDILVHTDEINIEIIAVNVDGGG